MGLLKRFFTSDRARLEEEIRDGLAADYSSELRLAQQLRAHAGEAPYAQAAERLRRLAELVDSQVRRLQTAIAERGAAIPAVHGTPQMGRNHWTRLVVDLDEVRAAGQRYLEQAIRWEDSDAPLGELLRALECEEQHHRQWLQDLVAKSDPHAIN